MPKTKCHARGRSASSGDKLWLLGLLVLFTAIIIIGCGGGGGGSSSGSSNGSGTFSIVTNPVTNITQTSATLNGTVNPNGVSTSVYFEYGKTTTYGSSVGLQNIGSGTTPVNVSADLTDLTPDTEYNYRIRCLRGVVTANGANKTFKTRRVNTSAPILASIGNKSANKNELLTFTISATDADAGDTLTYSSPNLPNGATLNPDTGAFSWLTPYLDKNYGVTFVVSDDGLPIYSDSETINITVAHVDRPPVLTAPDTASIDENQLLTFTLSATDPDLIDTITFSMTPIPPSATFNSTTGEFSWTPTYEQSGIYTVTFTATSNSLSHSKTTTITVNNVNRAPVITFIGNKYIDEGQLLSFTVSAADPDNNSLSYSMIPTVTGVNLNPNTGAFLWTPNYTQSGIYNVTFTATDNGVPHLSDSEAITIAVQNIPHPPIVYTNPAHIIAGSAVLNGTVNPLELATTAYFEYGSTTSYGITTTNQAIGNGITDVNITATITGLSSTPIYYFRLVAYSSAGTTNDNSRSFSTIPIPPIAIGGYNHCLCIKPDRTLWGWGVNTNGELGQGNTVSPQYTPIQIGTDNNWKTIVAGGSGSNSGFSFGIKTDSTLWAWGKNDVGQLGLGHTIPISVPTQVGTDTNWQTVSAGTTHTLAIKTDGTLWAWGANNNGQLGRNDQVTPQASPVQIGTDTWRAVSAGNQHSLAIKTDGTLWAWGLNNTGQLGDTTTTTRLAPVSIGTDTWSAVEASRPGMIIWNHSLGIKTDGTLWSWGYNNATYGNLGLGNNKTNRYSPTQVITPTGATWQAIKAGSQSSFAIRSDGTVWSCGASAAGALGRSGDTTILGQVGTTNDWMSLASGNYNTIGIRVNNSQYEVWGWGSGENGSLGGSGQTSTPVKIDIDLGSETGNWTRKTPASSPPVRCCHSMVWDGTKGILFGGQGTSGVYYNDLWWYYPATDTWINNTPTAISPSARNGLSMVWDGSNVIMFGGFNSTSYYLNDLWWYNPAANIWSQQIAINTPGSPVSRYGHTMVWDSNRVIMFGGYNADTGALNDLWWYYPVTNTWIQQSPIGGPPAGRSGHKMVWDGSKVIMFGGQGSGACLNDLWWYYPTTNTWTQKITINTPGSPVSRYGHTIVWDGTRVIMFGGSNFTSPYYLDDLLWWYDPANNTWIDKTSYIGDTPLARQFPSMIWDNTRAIMFGGSSSSSGYRNDLWWYSP